MIPKIDTDCSVSKQLNASHLMTADYFTVGRREFYILLLLGLQTGPASRFFTNLLRKSEEYKVNSHKSGLFSIVPHTPKRGVH